MIQIQTLASIEGRSLLRDLYKELRFERQMSGIASLLATLRICIGETEIGRISKREAFILHPLGVRRGITLWMQEIVNRYYFSAISSFVYFGAAILLALVGMNRFTSGVSNSYVIAGLVLESGILIAMFIVMFFAPPDEEDLRSGEEEESEARELIREIGEISSDYAGFTSRAEELTDTLSGLTARHDELISAVNESVRTAVMAVAPQPELLQQMSEATKAMKEFTKAVQEFTATAQEIRTKETQLLVRAEVERIIQGRLQQ
jgi:gas vesicle protein